MGVVVNGATDLSASLLNAQFGAANGLKSPLNMVNKPQLDKILRNTSHSLDYGSNACPVLKEGRQCFAGMA